MKKIELLVYAVSVTAAFIACSKIDQPVEEISIPSDPPKEWKVSIQATKGDANETKALSENGNTITASWKEGDVVYICNNNYDYGQLKAQSDGDVTMLSGTVTRTMTVGKTYTLRYLQKGENYLYLCTQKGTLEDIAKNHDMAEATVTVKSIDGDKVVFEETSVQFESKVSITKFTFDRKIKGLTIFCSNLKTYVRPGYTANYGHVFLNLTEEVQTIYVAMSTLEAKKATYLFLAKGTDDLYYSASKKAQLENGKNYTASVNLLYYPDCVDLGIDRGGHSICWGTRNLGASGPGQIGDYYAWAETAPKSTYSWDNYAYGSYTLLTKYNDRSDLGVVDNRYSLEPGDDAATVKLGASWRMPSLDDFKDLLNSDKVEKMLTYCDGRWGYCFHSLISGHTDKFIFLPVTRGYVKEGSSTNTNWGCYWSNQIEQSSWTSSSFANYLKIQNSIYSSPETGMMERAYGLAVRAVHVE